jgi:hypothetical protein
MIPKEIIYAAGILVWLGLMTVALRIAYKTDPKATSVGCTIWFGLSVAFTVILILVTIGVERLVAQ